MFTVAALYHFAPFDNPAAVKPHLLEACRANGVKGTLLLAREGINGTIAGQQAGLDAVLAQIRNLPGCEALDVKFSTASDLPFHRMKVRLKKEIVTLGVPGIDPSRDVGRYVEAAEWNALISDPETIVIDTRNEYEVKIGTFKGALDPKTRSFSQFPDWFRAHRAEFGNNPKVAMFCTGGIRCEKSTAFLRAEGIEDVAHLKGGILKYLETVPKEKSLWEGECFVFDERVSVGHGLAPGSHSLCRACRMPLSSEDCGSVDYIEGVQCPYCAASRTEEQRQRYAERHKQVALAERRGKRHVGDLEG
ncbi:MAG: rhodanese-related sulfurtransferase [Sphingomonadaceae bacterium]|nr:rhodanese-related sulfurtransferase [Sphingomonadaceae bacterium]